MYSTPVTRTGDKAPDKIGNEKKPECINRHMNNYNNERIKVAVIDSCNELREHCEIEQRYFRIEEVGDKPLLISCAQWQLIWDV